MILDRLTRQEVRTLIDEFTTSEKLRYQLRERILEGRSYAEMDLVGDRLKEKEYVKFKKNYGSFILFAERKVGNNAEE